MDTQSSPNGSPSKSPSQKPSKPQCEATAHEQLGACVSFVQTSTGIIAGTGTVACAAGSAATFEGGGALAFAPCENTTLGIATTFGATGTIRCMLQFQQEIAACEGH
jgi:hypothetical protein